MRRRCLVLLTMLALCAPWAGGEAGMTLGAELEARLAASSAGERIGVIVTLRAAEDLARVRARGITPDLVFASIAAFSARLSAAEIRALAGMAEVQMIELDREAQALGR